MIRRSGVWRPLLTLLWLGLYLCPLGLRAEERRGRLPNGLDYILRYSATPKDKLEARLVLRFGSGVQREDEVGFAHFIEHLAFGETRHFPQRGGVRYAERLGARYGIGINALTGYDRTVYMLSLPTDEPHVLDSTCLLLSDWLGGLTFTAQDVEAEKRIIKEEIRSYEQPDPFYRLKIGQGKESTALPIGTPEAIDRVSYSALHSFYQRWYRASHATVLLVGDFDLAEAEQSLTKYLGALPAAASILPPEKPLNYGLGLERMTLTDTLVRTAKLDLIFPYATRPTRTLREYYEDRLMALALGAWGHRLEGLRGVSVTDHWYLGRSNHLALTFEGAERASLLQAVEEALGALSVLRKRGITEEELEALKERQLRRCYLADSTTSSEGWTSYYLDQILHGDFFFTSREEIRQFHEYFDRLRPRDLRPAFQALHRITSSSRSLESYLYNPQESQQHPSDSLSLLQAIRRGLRAVHTKLHYRPRPAEPPQSSTVATPALLLPPKHLPTVGHLSRTAYPELGAEEVTLPNGLRVVLRPAGRGDSVVKLAMTQASGLRHIPRSEGARLSSLAAYMELGGIAKLPKETLDSFLYDRGIALTLTEGMDTGTLFGTSSTAETYALLRLLREKMTDPERAYSDFEDSRASMLEALGTTSSLARMLARQPERLLQRRLDSLLGIFVPSPEPTTREEIEGLNLDHLVSYHVDQWTRTEGLTLTAVGDFDREMLLRQILDVFGDLPTRPVKPYPPLPAISPEPVYTLEREEAGQEATLQHVYYGSYSPGLRGSLRLKLMREVLRNRLIERLRTRAGIIYSPYLYMEYRPAPSPFVSYRLELLVQPENAPLAGLLVEELVAELQQSLPTEQELADIRRTFLINKREALTEDALSGWQDALVGLLRQGESLQDFAHYEALLASITPAEVREGFQQVFSSQRHLVYSLVPKQ